MTKLPTPCHTCRRRRLKCDGFKPACKKCISRGQECLGYGQLFLWQDSVASRGKLAGVSSREMTSAFDRTPSRAPTDPFFQDISLASRSYVSYFSSHVCKDLVLYDTPRHNEFRTLIPMAQQYPILFDTVTAIAALHMFNAAQPWFAYNTNTNGVTNSNSTSPYCTKPCSAAFEHALQAKQRALKSLRYALDSTAMNEVDIILATVLLLVEFELLDSGKDNWRHHISGARSFIEKFCGNDMLCQADMSPLRRCLISNCAVFDILGSSLACSPSLGPEDTFQIRRLSLLQDEEGNHCSSFPVTLLRLLQAAAQIDTAGTKLGSVEQATASLLLDAATAFDPIVWASKIQRRSPVADLQQRTHLAAAHQAAVCIYLFRTSSLPSDPASLQKLAAETIHHLSSIQESSPIFAATAWPTFIAGAETDDTTSQNWVSDRFRDLWAVEPWGMIKEALEVLQSIWSEKRPSSVKDAVSGRNWVSDLRARDVHWLIA